jgi:ankyrin repeat protein
MNVGNSYALHDAVERGYVKVTKKLISYGADVNSFNHFYYTPLHWACDPPSNNAELVRILVNAGANVNKFGSSGRDYSAAHRCAWRNEAGAMQELIDAGINLDIRHNGKTALMFANEYGSYSLKKMIRDEYCKSVYEYDINKYLKRKDEYNAAKALNGCPIDQYSGYLYQAFDNRESALFHAVKLGYLDVVKGLIDAGVDVNERNPITPK